MAEEQGTPQNRTRPARQTNLRPAQGARLAEGPLWLDRLGPGDRRTRPHPRLARRWLRRQVPGQGLWPHHRDPRGGPVLLRRDQHVRPHVPPHHGPRGNRLSHRSSSERRNHRLQRWFDRTVGILLLAVLALAGTAGCHKPQEAPQSPQALYDSIRARYVHGDLSGSQVAADQAVARFTPGDPAWEWRFRFLDASIRLWQGKSAEALALMQKELPASLPPAEFAVQRYELRVFAFTRLGKLAQAEAEAQQALKISADTHSPFRAEACLAAGVAYIELNELPEAAKILREGREAAHSRSDTFLEATFLANQSVVALRQEHYDEAFEALNNATTLARSIDAKLRLENTLGNTGWAYHEIGDHERARASFVEAAAEAEKLGNQLDEVRWLNNLGVELGALNDLNGAEAAFRRALSLAQSIQSDRETISIEMGLAAVLYDRGQYAEDKKICDAALPAAHSNHNFATELDLLYLKGLLAEKGGDVEEAEADFRELDNHPQAQPLHRLDAEDSLAGLFDEKGRTQLAEIWYRKAVNTFEAQRATIRNEESRLPFFANAEAMVYPDFAQFLIHHHREEEALKVVDFARARALEEGLRLNPTKIGSTFGDPGLNPRSLAARLHATLIEYSLGEKESWMWVATPARLQLFRLPAKDKIAAEVAAYRKAILHADDVLAARNAAGIALYDSLIAPAQNLIPRQSRVIVLPDGVLNEFNFETLLVSKPEPHFFIDDVTLENANSLRLLNSFASHRPAKKNPNLLLIGDPVPPAGQFNDLLNAPQEVSAVADHFPPDRRTVVTGERASPVSYGKSHPEEFTYIHFVAHGTASRLEPLSSAIVLSGNPDSPQNYRLLARDIIHNPLAADLVTISTCYGSGSREYAGEGLLGLSWAFLRAGAHSVVGALWEVSDLSTPQLMDKLYAGMQHGLPPDDALRQSKLALAHAQGTFRKPFYWAAFQVYAGS
ncbi:CHAT domain-containing protein [Acidobacteria bacterium AB60]|nr:CHAT domain-containing protein [Acidobacteria bacterium AB60]